MPTRFLAVPLLLLFSRVSSAHLLVRSAEPDLLPSAVR
jgi:hypothetical protein